MTFSESSSLHKVNPKTARGKRFLESREPKVFEDVKSAIFMRSSKTSAVSSQALSDLYSLKKPDAIMLHKKNAINPFEGGENETTLNFLSHRNGASFAIIAAHSKKRPDNLVFVRFFDNHILDMCEFGITKLESIVQVGGPTCSIGSKPAMVFNGELFEQREEYKKVQNMFLDYFRGQVVDSLNLAGLETLISVTATEDRLLLRVYRVLLKKSSSRTPRVELQLMGPSMDLIVGRGRWASDDLMKQALRKPKEIKPKKEKNVSTTVLGETMGKVHVGQQKLEQIQTRKMKALKKGGNGDKDKDSKDKDSKDKDSKDKEEKSSKDEKSSSKDEKSSFKDNKSSSKDNKSSSKDKKSSKKPRVQDE